LLLAAERCGTWTALWLLTHLHINKLPRCCKVRRLLTATSALLPHGCRRASQAATFGWQMSPYQQPTCSMQWSRCGWFLLLLLPRAWLLLLQLSSCGWRTAAGNMREEATGAVAAAPAVGRCLALLS